MFLGKRTSAGAGTRLQGLRGGRCRYHRHRRDPHRQDFPPSCLPPPPPPPPPPPLLQLVQVVLKAAFLNCGQNCAGGERFFVHEKIYDK